jgi:hypothetical protein
MQRLRKWGLLYHLAVAALLFGLPGLRLGTPAWHMPPPLLLVFGGMAGAYLVAALIVALRGSTGWLDAPLIGLAILGAATIAIQGLDIQFPRAAFLAVVALALIALTIGRVLRGLLPPLSVMAAMAATAVLVLPAKTHVVLRPDVPSSHAHETMTTAFYPLEVERFKNVVPSGRKFTAFGSILEFGAGYLVATGDGEIFKVGLPENADAQVERLPTRVPLNIDAFDKATNTNKSGQFFRLMDLRIRDNDGQLLVLASHHWWNAAHRCSVLQVSELETTRQAFETTRLDDHWKTIYQSTPCLPLADTDWPFSGMEGGGRIRFLDDSTFLLTIGDHGFNDVVYSPDYVSDTAASYGKTWKVHLGGGRKPELFTIGHRNPQGLFIDPAGQVWETEHGAQGGDELNLLRAGVNYGWPHVTYGTNYGRFTWPRNPVQGEHAGYTLPVYAWVPSIGTSNLIRLRGDLFPLWKSDLLVSALNGGELFRVRLDGERVVFAEPITFGERIRDLLEDRTGRILLWTDTRSIIVIRPGPFPTTKDTPPAKTTGAIP